MGEQLLWAVKNGESDVVKKIIVSELFAVNIVQCVFLTVTTCCVVSRPHGLSSLIARLTLK